MFNNNATFSVDSKELASAIQWASNGVESKPTSTTGSVIIMTLEGTTLSLEAFDGTGHFKSSVAVSRDVSDDGLDVKRVLNGAMLRGVVKLLKGQATNLRVDGRSLLIKVGRGSYNLNFLPEDRLNIPPQAEVAGTINAGELKHAVNQVVAAASNDEILVELTGVLIEFHPKTKTIRMVATDRYQMSLCEISFDPAPTLTEQYDVLVPAKDLKRLLQGTNNAETLTIRAGGQVKFFGVETTYEQGSVGLLSNEFVKYERLMTATYANDLVVDRNELRNAVSNTAAFLSKNDPVIIKISHNLINISGTTDKTSSDVDVDAEVTFTSDAPDTDKTINFSFGQELLMGALSSATSTKVSIQFNQAGRPVLFKEVNEEDARLEHWQHLVMPRRDIVR